MRQGHKIRSEYLVELVPDCTTLSVGRCQSSQERCGLCYTRDFAQVANWSGVFATVQMPVLVVLRHLICVVIPLQ
ncbi:hypothetical protein NIES4075_67780 [Tolypothrix sp. NIES-4075]|nr:hypothetical protein NIES4075_67780 [Tolypothrix sp. NIES-4075]